MSFITIIVCAFVIGYAFIALESVTKINKAAIAVLMCVVCWTLLALGYEGLAKKHFANYAEKIEKILLEIFGEVYQRNGAWMSKQN